MIMKIIGSTFLMAIGTTTIFLDDYLEFDMSLSNLSEIQNNQDQFNDNLENNHIISVNSINSSVTKLNFSCNEHEKLDEHNNNEDDSSHTDFINFFKEDFYKKDEKQNSLDNKKSISDGSISPIIINFEHSHSTINKIENNNDALLEYLEFIDIPDPPKEELDKCKPVTMDFETLNTILNFEKNSTSLKEILSSRNQLIEDNVLLDVTAPIIKENLKIASTDLQGKFKKSVIDKSISDNSNIAHDTTLPLVTAGKEQSPIQGDIMEMVGPKECTFLSFIERFISENIHSSYSYNHIKRVRSISKAINICSKFKLDFRAYLSIFDPSHDKELTIKLKDLVSSFDKNTKFNYETFEFFLEKFDAEVFNSLYTVDYCVKSNLLQDCQKTLIFYYEFMQLYNYLDDIPELLTLGGLLDDKSFRGITSLIHLMNLFVKQSDNAKDNRTFILCMINKAFKSFHSGLFDIFRVPVYELECINGKHNLNYFLWEVHYNKRQDIRRRKKAISKYMYQDNKFLKAIFLTYLYQHTIFMNFYNVEVLNINSFKDFIKKAASSNDCIGCLFNEYMSIIRKQTKIFIKV